MYFSGRGQELLLFVTLLVINGVCRTVSQYEESKKLAVVVLVLFIIIYTVAKSALF